MSEALETLVIRHTLRVPAPVGPAGDGAAEARQLDVTLLSAGFKLSGELLCRLSELDPDGVEAVGKRVLDSVRELVGAHVHHNAYFERFPEGVPGTVEFWMTCISDALRDEGARPSVLAQLDVGVIDLLTLPSYGIYQHTYDDMIAVHEPLLAAAGDRMTVLHLGAVLDDEVRALYLALAGSRTPLGESGLEDLAQLARVCVDGAQPEAVPIRENRAVVNAARLGAGRPLLADTVTDVLRTACALAGGDVTLTTPSRFGGFRRPVRRALLAALDEVVAGAPGKLADVAKHAEEFKRLGERLHPHEYPRFPHAAEVFAVARGERKVSSLAGQVEAALAGREAAVAAGLLATAPGQLFRGLDQLLRCADGDEQAAAVVVDTAREVAGRVAGRVLLSVREHLMNREVADRDAIGSESRSATSSARPRVFVNRSGRAWVTPDRRRPLPADLRRDLLDLLDAELRRRLPAPARLLVDPAMLDVALPLSGRAAAAGFGVLPRGSVSAVEGDLLRFFVFWQQAARSTDFDLSALLLGADYETRTWLSFTELSSLEGEHSGDIVTAPAPDGASEFINLRLASVRDTFIVPQVNVYSGEDFEQVAECFFGFMLREAEQQGQPFEARTVRLKSELRGPGRVALPLVFQQTADGTWRAKWLHLYLWGMPAANRVEENRVSVARLLPGIVEREYLTVRHLLELWGVDLGAVLWDGTTLPAEPVTFLGLQRPDGLHPDSVVRTPENLRDLVPA